MSERIYDKATAEAIFELAYGRDLGDEPDESDATRGPRDGAHGSGSDSTSNWRPYVVRNNGIYRSTPHRAESPVDEVFDWVPASDMDWFDHLTRSKAPMLPIPFTARELAACMLDGAGAAVQDALGSKLGYPLVDDAAMEDLSDRDPMTAGALREAYVVAVLAQAKVGEFDYAAHQAAHDARQGARSADKRTTTRKIWEKQESKWKRWRRAMVRALLKPDSSGDTDAPLATIETNQTSTHEPKTGEIPMTRRALVRLCESIWPTVVADINRAKSNGLANSAKAGTRRWWKSRALQWAEANGKLIKNECLKRASPLPTLSSLPSRVHRLDG